MQESMVRTVHNTIDASKMDIKVHVERHVWSKMHGWCKAANSEVSGLFMVRLKEWEWQFKDGKIQPKALFEAYDIYFPEQKCTAAFTELAETSVAKLSMRLHKKKKKLEDLRGWWHTHYTMSTFWSGTDDNTAQRLARTNGQWLVSIVVNQKGHWLCRVDMMKPVNMVFDKVEVLLIPNSRKLKRKRNFKSDIKKWVKPFYEFNYKSDDKDDYKPGKGYYPHDWKQWQEHKGDKQGDFFEHRTSGKDDESLFKRIKEGKPYKFGQFIVYNGTCMSRREFKDLTGKDCWCEDGKCPDCKSGAFKTCFCTEHYECTFCKQDNAKEKCPCKHNDDWEACNCSHDCYYCVEKISNYC